MFSVTTRILPFFIGGSLVFAAILSGCQKTRPPAPPKENKQASKEIEALFRELRELRSRVERSAGQPVVVLEDLPADYKINPVPTLQIIRRDLFELVRTFDQRESRRTFQTGQSVNSLFFSGLSGSASVKIAEAVIPRSITVSNVGAKMIVNPRVTANSSGDWFDIDTILAQVLPSDISDRDKALALWSFVVQSRRHDNPSHSGKELHDPIKFLNVYGYGLCDDSATVLAALAIKAGLQSRIWMLDGHVVPELYFDGAWRMLDPDGEIYYVKDDGSIADVETLGKFPDLIRKQPSKVYPDAEKLIKIYSPGKARLSNLDKRFADEPHRMQYSLRPGESLLRVASGWGDYFSAHIYREPRLYGNGRLTFHPIFAGDLYKVGSEKAEGFSTLPENGPSPLITTDGAMLTYRFRLPYAMVNGRISGELQATEPSSSVRIEISEDGHTWLEVGQRVASGSWDFPLRAFFRNGFGDPVYDYQIRLSFQGSAQVSALEFVTDVQVAPKSLPLLRQGDNAIVYRAEGEPGSQVKIDLGYDTVPANQ